jgi:predicted O-linked N-acetylglucosamine transferase (SPINDLY family)
MVHNGGSQSRVVERAAPAEAEVGLVLFHEARVAADVGNREVAVRCVERAIEGQPGSSQIRHDAALLLAELGELDAAYTNMKEAARLSPRTPEILNNLGTLLVQLGRASEAIAAYRQAITLSPSAALLHLNLAEALEAAGYREQSIAELRIAATLEPDLQRAWAILGESLFSGGLPAASVGPLRRAFELDPNNVTSCCQLALALRAAGNLCESVRRFRQATGLDAENVPAWFGYGQALLEDERFVEAIEAFDKCLALEPDHIAAIHERAKGLFHLGCVEEAVAALRRIVDCGLPDFQLLVLQNLAVMAPGNPGDDNRSIIESRRSWTERLPTRPPLRRSRHDASSLLRIGYMSSFFHRHNWMKPVWPLINGHHRKQFQIHLFSDASADRVEGGYRPHASDIYHDVSRLSNEELADYIRGQQIDILIDLNGYSEPKRMPLYPLRPAPTIVGWFNMYATSGLDCFDYLVGDAHVIHEHEERWYAEKILRVPGSYLTFEVNYRVPDVAPAPMLSTGCITLGCLASQYKITDQVVETWSAILRHAPTARILLRNKTLGRPEHDAHLRSRFAKWNIGPERLIFEGPTDHFDFLRTYDRIDLALDPFPYSGGTTTTEAIWQGVPVITFDGDRWASRTSVSLLKTAGLEEFVASDRDDYIRLCVQRVTSSKSAERLCAFRATIRDRLQQSSVCATGKFVQAMETLYLQIASH